jgi:hypothetical protein
MMRAMGLPRAFMEQAFGHTGLPMYEKMLAQLEAREKTIEGEVIRE